MTKRASEEILSALHETLAQKLLARIQDGTATAADLNVARAFLKDNGVDAVPAPQSPLGNLMENLPFNAGEDTSTFN